MAKPKKLDNGLYLMRVRFKHPVTNKWSEKQKQFPTKKLCREWEATILKQYSPEEYKKNLGMATDKDRMILADFFDLWNETFKKRKVGEDHQRKIANTKKHALAFFGEGVRLDEIDRIRYQQWLNYLGYDKNFAVATVRDYHKILKAVLLEAQENGLIKTNPASKPDIVGRDTSGEKKRSLTINEWEKLLEAVLNAEDSASKYATLTMMFVGCRFQEVDGLLVSDVLFKSEQLRINKAFDYKRTKDFAPTKTMGSNRIVDMPSKLAYLLKQYVSRYFKSSKIVSLEGNQPRNREYLFPGPLGVPITNAAINKFIKKCCHKAGIEEVTSHAFRHAKTDILVLAGADMIYTQKQLGHQDASTTLKYYSTLNEDIRKKNNTIQNDFLNGVQATIKITTV